MQTVLGININFLRKSPVTATPSRLVIRPSLNQTPRVAGYEAFGDCRPSQEITAAAVLVPSGVVSSGAYAEPAVQPTMLTFLEQKRASEQR